MRSEYRRASQRQWFERWGWLGLVFGILALGTSIAAVWTGSVKMGGTCGILWGAMVLCGIGMLITSEF